MSDLQLIEAAKAGDVTNATHLIETGVDVNQQDDHGWTPLNWAAGRGDLQMVSLLIEKGADPFKVGRDRRTPYDIALAAGHVEVVKYLRQVEANAEGEKPERPQRKYCKAYHLKSLREFSQFPEAVKSGDQADSQDDKVVFIHQDYTVTESMWHGENVVFDRVSPEWQEFCEKQLGFKVPDDLDLIVPSAASGSGPS